MAHVSIDSLKIHGVTQELECSVCLETFKKPKVLNCMHTFCEECLLHIAVPQNDAAYGNQSDENESDESFEEGSETSEEEPPRSFVKEFDYSRVVRIGDSDSESSEDEIDHQIMITQHAELKIICPQCRQVTKFSEADSLPTNYIAQNIAEKLETPKCHDCIEDAAASKYCQHCKLNLCVNCVHYHQKSVRFSDHTLVDITHATVTSTSNATKYCLKHKELLKYFCEQCEVIVCNDCMLSDTHRKHDFGLIEEEKEKRLQEVHQLIFTGDNAEKIISKIIDDGTAFVINAENSKQESLALIRRCFLDIRNSFNEREEQMIKEVEESCKVVSKDSLQEAQTKFNNLKDLLKYAKSASKLDTGNENDIQMLQTLKNQIQGFFNEVAVNAMSYKNIVLNRKRVESSGLLLNSKCHTENKVPQYLCSWSTQSLCSWSTQSFDRACGNITISMSSKKVNINEEVKNTLKQSLMSKINISDM